MILFETAVTSLLLYKSLIFSILSRGQRLLSNLLASKLIEIVMQIHKFAVRPVRTPTIRIYI